MKKIILILSLLISLIYGKNISFNTTLTNAKTVSQTNWTNSNKALQNFMDIHGKEFIKTFVHLLQKQSKENTLILKLEHFHHAISYIKYLESKKQTQKSLTIYTHILTNTIKPDNIIKLTYQQNIENILTTSIKDTLKSKIYNKQELQTLKTLLTKNLTKDTKILQSIMKIQKDKAKEYCLNEYAIFELYPTPYSYIKYLETNTTNLQKLHKTICNITDGLKEVYNTQVTKTTNESDNNITKQAMKQLNDVVIQKLEILPRLSKKQLNQIKNEPQHYIQTYANIIFILSNPNFADMKTILLNQIKINQDLIKSF